MPTNPALADPDEPTPASPTPASPTPASPNLPNRRAANRRPSIAGATIGLLVGLLGFALVVQARGNAQDAQLAAARPDDLVRILSDLDARQERLREEIADLEDSRRRLDSGVRGREAALTEARRRADELGILAGTLPASGPGLSIRFVPGPEPIRAVHLLDAVEELRGAGAEAMQVGGAGTGGPVRIIASTAFVDAGDGISFGGIRLTAPYTLEVIGEPRTMRTALNIPGGVVDTLRRVGGSAVLEEHQTVLVSATASRATMRYARPAS